MLILMAYLANMAKLVCLHLILKIKLDVFSPEVFFFLELNYICFVLAAFIVLNREILLIALQ